MTNLCISIYRYFRHHRVIFWSSLIALFLVFGFFASQIHLEEDLNKLMPESKNEDGSTKLAFGNLKIKDKTFLLFEGVKGIPADSLVDVCDEFVDSLTALNTTSHVIDNIFYQIPEELIPDAIDYMSAHLPAYIDTSMYRKIDTLLTLPHLKRQMRRNYNDLQGDFGSQFPELIEMDPIGLRTLLQEQYAPFLRGSAGGYKTINGHFFVPDSTVCVAFITPQYAATNTGQGSRLFDILNEQIEKFKFSHPNVTISYHGTPASGYYNAQTIKHDLCNTIGGSLVLVIIFIYLCFRNNNTLLLLLLPVAFGTLFSLTLMYFLKGQFSLLALGMGAVVLGVAISYVLHVLTHYKYVNDPEQVLCDEVKPVCLGCLTTVGSFIGLLFIHADLLRDFGLFATFAIVGTTAFSLVYLPQFFNPKKNKLNRRLFAAIDSLNAYPFDRKKPLIAVLTLLIAICIGVWLFKGTRFDADMHDLGYKDQMVKHSEELLRAKTFTGDKTKYFATTGATMEEALSRFGQMAAQLDSLEHAGLVKSYTHTNLLFVPLQDQQVRIDAWKRYWTPERLQHVRQLIAATAPSAGLDIDGFDRFFESTTATYHPDALYKAGIIPEGYLSTLMEQSYDGEWLCFTSVRCKNDSVRNRESDYNKICDAVANQPNQMVLDTYYYTTDTLNKLNNDFNTLQWVSMLFVLAVLFFSFHCNIKNTLLGFMPIVLSWLVVLGMMDIFGYQFNLINIIISTFIFGIGVDYSIFVMSGLMTTSGNTNLLGYHKTAIFFSAVVLMVTVGSMLLARHPAIRSVGFCTLTGLIAAVVISYVMLPAGYRWLWRKSLPQAPVHTEDNKNNRPTIRR